MKLTRKEDISLYLYIKDSVIGPEFYEIAEEESLTLVGTNTWEMSHSSEKCPFERYPCDGFGRGILYFDVADGCCTFGTEQSDMVDVYNGSVTPASYSVNYLKGQVVTPYDVSSYSVDYMWNYVAVIDAWPYEDVPPLPIVSVELQDASARPLQLGYGDIRTGFWNIQIFAESKGQRDDLMDVVYEGVQQKRCNIYDFENGLPLVKSGLFNSEFTLSSNETYKFLHFENVKKSLSGLPQWGFYTQELINRYRAEITFETLAFKK